MTQQGLIIKHLKTHPKVGITSKEAIERYSCTRLSAVINAIEKKGYVINKTRETVQTKYGNVSITRYVLEKYMDLITRIQNLIGELQQYINGLKNWGIKRAGAEKEYQTVMAQAVLKERDAGTAIGVINLVVKGKKDVAEKRMERDIAEVMYQVSQEKINVAKLELRLLDSQASREWSVKE